jgi:hypothetical protein
MFGIEYRHTKERARNGAVVFIDKSGTTGSEDARYQDNRQRDTQLSKRASNLQSGSDRLHRLQHGRWRKNPTRVDGEACSGLPRIPETFQNHSTLERTVRSAFTGPETKRGCFGPDVKLRDPRTKAHRQLRIAEY